MSIPITIEVSDLYALRECATRLRCISSMDGVSGEDHYYMREAETILLDLLLQVDECMDAEVDA